MTRKKVGKKMPASAEAKKMPAGAEARPTKAVRLDLDKVGKKMPAGAEAKPTKPTKAVRLDLDADLHKRLRMAAAAADKSMAAYARDVIDRHLRGDKKK